MFTSRKRLQARSGKKGVDRFEYLQELANEFQQSPSLECKEQVLANLANFAYDPLNYHYLRELKIVELFLDNLFDVNPFLVEYSIKGICNLVNDPVNQEIIFSGDGIERIKRLVYTDNPAILCPALTTLIFLAPSAHSDLIQPDFVALLQKLQEEGSQPAKNLAEILLTDYCQLMK